MFPGLHKRNLIPPLSWKDVKGVILETFGSGNVTNEPWLTHALSEIIKKNTW
ncbi:MAG: hypothetical protein R2776_01310 [Flavobacteriaceae bacterium]